MPFALADFKKVRTFAFAFRNEQYLKLQ